MFKLIALVCAISGQDCRELTYQAEQFPTEVSCMEKGEQEAPILHQMIQAQTQGQLGVVGYRCEAIDEPA